ncbi:hypothetical protein [Streptomyces sp. NPDC005125]
MGLARVVTAQACGIRRAGLDELLFGPDRIHQSIDALTYALHDRQLHREMRVLSGNPHCTGRHNLTLHKTPRAPAQLEQLHARRRLFAFETRAGRLQFPGSRTELRHQILAELDRRHSR